MSRPPTHCSECGQPLPDNGRDRGVSLATTVMRFGYGTLLAGGCVHLTPRIKDTPWRVSELEGFTVEMPVTDDWQKQLDGTTGAFEAWVANIDLAFGERDGWVYWQLPHVTWEIIKPEPFWSDTGSFVDPVRLKGDASQPRPVTDTPWLPRDVEHGDAVGVYCLTSVDPPSIECEVPA